MRERKKKRGQFFIIGAVILGIIILSMTGIWNLALKGKGDVSQKKFQALCENYKREIFEISKYAVASGNKSNESDFNLDFTIKFLEYAKGSEPNFKLLYVYGNNGSATIFNATNYTLTVSISAASSSISWTSENDYSYATITGTGIQWINVSDTNINKQYAISENERFYFMALEEKNGEKYICE
ncbi:MAG: hypothetical protein QW625_02170 [Candidatus Nanoarchaeia archaeon]